MELTHRFTVPAPIDAAWEAFNDLERIAPCFPGAALTSYDGETFEGLVKVKLGPISMQYTGTGRFVERDEAAHLAVIEAKGKDKRGNGTAAAKVTARLQSVGADSTDVVVATDLNVTGKPAQFGRGVMQDVSDKLLGQFATCLETKLDVGSDAEPAAELAPEPAAELAPEPASESEPVVGEPIEPRHRSDEQVTSAGPEAAQLDLAATVLPVLMKRYAPYAAAAVVLSLLALRLRKRRHHHHHV